MTFAIVVRSVFSEVVQTVKNIKWFRRDSILALILSPIFLFLSAHNVSSQCSGFDSKILFSGGSGVGHSITTTADGGFLLAGVSSSIGPGADDWVLIKVDENLEPVWTKAIGYASTNEGGRDLVVEELSSGQIVLGGFRLQGFRKAHIMLFSEAGDLLWTREMGDYYSVPRDIKSQPDGNFVVVGTLNVPEGASEDAYLMKFDLTGTILWSHRFDSEVGNDHFYGLTDASNGNIVVTGSSVGYSGAHSGMVVEFEQNGAIVGQHTYHEGPLTQFLDIQRTSDNHYLIGAHQLIGNTSIGVVMKLSPDYEIVWQRKLHQGQRNYVADVNLLGNGDVIAHYQIDNDNNALNRFGVAVMNYQTGEIINTVVPDLDEAHDVQVTTKNMALLPNDAIVSIGATNNNISLIGFNSCLEFTCEESAAHEELSSTFTKVIYEMPVFTCPTMTIASPAIEDLTEISTVPTCTECLDGLIVSDVTVCEGENPVLIAGLEESPGESIDVDWEIFGIGLFTGQEIELAILDVGVYPFTVTGITAAGCSYSSEGVLDVIESPTPPVPVDPMFVCTGENLSHDFSEYAGLYAVYNEDGESLENYVVNFDSPGVYVFTFENDCAGTFEIELEVISSIGDFALEMPDAVCAGSEFEVSIDGFLGLGDNVLLTVDYGDGSSEIVTGQSINLVYENSGIYTVQLIAQADDCVITDTAEVTVDDDLSFEIEDEVNICQGDVFELDFSIYPFEVFAQSGNAMSFFTTSQSGVYEFTAINACGSLTAQVDLSVITFNPRPLNLIQEICPDRDTLELGFRDDNFIFNWSTGSSGPAIEVHEAGTYFVEVSDSSQLCTRSHMFNVNEIPFAPQAAFPDDIITLCEEGMRMVHPRFVGYPYTFPDGSIGYNYEVENEGFIEVEYSDNCYTYYDDVYVQIRECLCPMWVPNAFTPDGDGINEVFKPVVDCPVKNYHFQIFNRWGKLIFESRDIEMGWNGASPNNEFFAEGTLFIYLIRYEQNLDGADVPSEITGHVSLLR